MPRAIPQNGGLNPRQPACEGCVDEEARGASTQIIRPRPADCNGPFARARALSEACRRISARRPLDRVSLSFESTFLRALSGAFRWPRPGEPAGAGPTHGRIRRRTVRSRCLSERSKEPTGPRLERVTKLRRRQVSGSVEALHGQALVGSPPRSEVQFYLRHSSGRGGTVCLRCLSTPERAP